MDSRTPRDGRVLEEIGLYHPIEKLEKQLAVDTAKVQDWLARGATPSNTVKQLLNRKTASTYSADSATRSPGDSATRSPADSATQSADTVGA